jgi:hypothetical protein
MASTEPQGYLRTGQNLHRGRRGGQLGHEFAGDAAAVRARSRRPSLQHSTARSGSDWCHGSATVGRRQEASALWQPFRVGLWELPGSCCRQQPAARLPTFQPPGP